MRLEESNGKLFLADLVGSNLGTAVAVRWVFTKAAIHQNGNSPNAHSDGSSPNADWGWSFTNVRGDFPTVLWYIR